MPQILNALDLLRAKHTEFMETRDELPDDELDESDYYEGLTDAYGVAVHMVATEYERIHEHLVALRGEIGAATNLEPLITALENALNGEGAR